MYSPISEAEGRYQSDVKWRPPSFTDIDLSQKGLTYSLCLFH